MRASLATLTRGRQHRFDLSIGCVSLRLHAADKQLLTAALARYAAFRARSRKPFAIYLEDTDEKSATDLEFAYDLEGARLRVYAAESYFSGVRNAYALDSMLRILLSWVLLSRAGFLLHAATILRHGRAYVFAGRSGAGKSTVATLSPPGSVLTDEISLLRCEDGVWHAYGTPFWGEFRAGEANISAPVAGIYRLVQAPENRVESLAPMQFLRNLLPNVLFFSEQPAANRRLLEILSQAAAELPGYHLAFRNHPAFWEVLPA